MHFLYSGTMLVDHGSQVLTCAVFTNWEVNRAKLASRVVFQRPAYYVPEQTLQQQVRERVFPDRKLRKRVPDIDIAAFDATCNEVRRLAAINEAEQWSQT